MSNLKSLFEAVEGYTFTVREFTRSATIYTVAYDEAEELAVVAEVLGDEIIVSEYRNIPSMEAALEIAADPNSVPDARWDSFEAWNTGEMPDQVNGCL